MYSPYGPQYAPPNTGYYNNRPGMGVGGAAIAGAGAGFLGGALIGSAMTSPHGYYGGGYGGAPPVNENPTTYISNDNTQPTETYDAGGGFDSGGGGGGFDSGGGGGFDSGGGFDGGAF